MTVTLDDFEDQDSSDTVDVFLTNISYTERGGKPIVHVFGRDVDGNYVHQEVYGHNPHFSVPESEYDERVANHYAVENVSDGLQTLDSEDTYRIETSLPKHVGDLRNFFENPLEADVLYETRWLIDNEITTGIRVPANSDRCHVSDIEPCEPPSPSSGTDDGSSTEVSSGDSVQPRIVTVDIEVASEHGFPEADEADWPVVSIVATDSYTSEYVGWLLCGDECQWEPSDVGETDIGDLRIFDAEKRLLDDFNMWVRATRPDLISGWNSSSTDQGKAFDIPYLINRCRNCSVWSYKDWSTLGEVFVTSRGTPVVKGVTMFDMLDAYVKSQIHSLDSKSLDAVANEELDAEKIDIELSYTEQWKQRPTELMEYNLRDVTLVEDIEADGGLVAMFNHLREVTGAQYADCFAAIDMLDPMFLREAADRDYVLPTASKPDRSWFYGGWVYDTKPGLHENVIYWDVASMYPHILVMCNISPETIAGFEGDNDQPHSFVDDRPENVKKDDDPDGEPFYYRRHDKNTGFVSSIVEEILELTETTSGKRREALKRSRNAVWGILGDGDSYGKGFRLFDWRMGESVTLAGRKIIQWTADEIVDALHEMGYDDAELVIADTDGAGFSVPSCESPEEAERIGYEIEKHVNERYDEVMPEMFNAPNEMEIEAESYAERLFTKGVKKKYAQTIRWER